MQTICEFSTTVSPSEQGMYLSAVSKSMLTKSNIFLQKNKKGSITSLLVLIISYSYFLKFAKPSSRNLTKLLMSLSYDFGSFVSRLPSASIKTYNGCAFALNCSI